MAISFTNLHISPEGWFISGHQKDGSQRTWDLSLLPTETKETICAAIAATISSGHAILILETERGIQ